MASRLNVGRAVWWVEDFRVCSGRIEGARGGTGGKVYQVCGGGGRKIKLYEEDAFFTPQAARRAALKELRGA